MSAATSSRDTPVYHAMILPFMTSVLYGGKIMARLFIYQYNNFYLCIDIINELEQS
jgi:hypothetical protein